VTHILDKNGRKLDTLRDSWIDEKDKQKELPDKWIGITEFYEEIPLWYVDPYGEIFSSLTIENNKSTSECNSSTSEGSSSSDDMSDNNMSDEQINQLWDDMIEAASVGVIDMDEVMAATASSMRGVSSDHLSKVWRISIEEADDTIKITSQSKIHSADPQLAKNYGTNDRMLRYKHINEYFFMDTFLATKKGGVSS
jgi:hypothetical protein